MASSGTGRVVRKSPRNASPMTTAANRTLSTPELESSKLKESTDAGEEWTEPPLRAPAPSFEDHKGLERQGVLEQMAPLGTMPSTKVKLRVKQYDPTRKSQSGKTTDGASGAKESADDAEVAGPSRRSESRKSDDRPTRQQSLRERDEDKEYSPKAVSIKPVTSSSTSTRTPTTRMSSTPNSKTAAGQERLRQVVESAVERARELGNENLGLAIRRLFEESLHKKPLAELLDAVLSQRPTPDQAVEFQLYIKVARKQIKVENSASRGSSVRASSVTGAAPPTKPAPKSPPKASRRSRSRNTGANTDLTETLTSTTPRKPQTNGKRAEPASKGEEQPSIKRIKRSGSMSSTSSLSSTHSAEFDSEVKPDIVIADEPTTVPNGLEARGSVVLPKMHTFSTKQHAGTKRGSGAMVSAESDVNDESTATELIAKRRKLARNSWPDYRVMESDIRGPPQPVVKETPSSPMFPAFQTSNLAHANGKEDGEDARSPASSVLGDFLVPPPPGAMRASRSRGVTPTAKGRNVARRGARVKMSPMKKKGPIAGIARATRASGDGSVGGDHADDGDGENVDYCTACGGNGELLCCDGCTRSFHFGCLDPPIDQRQPPEGEWFCYVCEAKRGRQPQFQRSLMRGLQRCLSKHNPTAYSLPDPIRNHFDGVKTGEEGEYEEYREPKARNKLVPGYDELQGDVFKLRDSKGNLTLCFRCGKSSLGRRELISCDYCNLKWHLDCLDPPLANPPRRDPLNRPKYNWMCPAHLEQDLEIAGHSRRMRKLRRPKNPVVKDSYLSRGVENNGIIEVANDSDLEEPEEEDGTVYRLSERSIKLDFIDRVKRSNAEEAERRAAREADAAQRALVAELIAQRIAEQSQAAFNARGLNERQAALTLAQLAEQNPDLGLRSDDVQKLINMLVREAPVEVLAMDDPGASGSSAQDFGLSTERRLLKDMEEAIRRRFAVIGRD